MRLRSAGLRLRPASDPVETLTGQVFAQPQDGAAYGIKFFPFFNLTSLSRFVLAISNLLTNQSIAPQLPLNSAR
jgi:hypothetical protein